MNIGIKDQFHDFKASSIFRISPDKFYAKFI